MPGWGGRAGGRSGRSARTGRSGGGGGGATDAERERQAQATQENSIASLRDQLQSKSRDELAAQLQGMGGTYAFRVPPSYSKPKIIALIVQQTREAQASRRALDNTER